MAGKKKKDEEAGEKKSMGQKLKPVLVIVAAAAGYKFFLAPKPATVAAPAEAVAAAAQKVEEGPVVTIPELVLNLAGPDMLSTRDIATQLAQRMSRPVAFVGHECDVALLSNGQAGYALLGRPRIAPAQMVAWTAHWVARGGPTLGKPTHFQTQTGQF